MADPIVVTIDALNTWQKIATNVTKGQVHALLHLNGRMYYHTYRMTGEAAPSNIIEGVPFMNAEIDAPVGSEIDVYICMKTDNNAYNKAKTTDMTGSVRLDL